MLRNQSFTPRPTLVLGHELFYDQEAPYQINFTRTADFISRIASPGKFNIIFVAKENSQDLEVKPEEYFKQLLDLKVPFSSMFVVKPLNPNHWVTLNQFLRLCDMAYAPELLSSSLVLFRNKCSTLSPSGIIECLLEAVAQPIPFSHELFTAISSQLI